MLLSREELIASAKIHPEAKAFYEKYPQPPARCDPLAARAMLRKFIEANLQRLGPAPPDMEELYHDILMRDGDMSSIKICRPSESPPGPLVVLIFGGGFIGGDNDQLTETARICVKLFGATVVNISYRLGPEHKFPFAQLDALDSLDWVAENATGALLKSNPTKGFIIGGVSAGASITAALTRQFQQQRLAYPVTGQWLAVPSLMHPGCCPPKFQSKYVSLEQNSSSPGLSEEAREMMRKAVQWDKSSELRYAANSKTPIGGQPRTYFQVDGMDPLRDDALIYDEMLKESGVPTKIDLYPGCPHAHWSSMRGLSIGNRALIDTVVGLGWLLQTSVSRQTAAEVLNVKLA